MTSSEETTKTPSGFESAFQTTDTTELEIVSCTVKFLKPFTKDEVKRVMILIEHKGINKKVYCFPDTVAGLKAPFKAELLLEHRNEFWNVTAVTELD